MPVGDEAPSARAVNEPPLPFGPPRLDLSHIKDPAHLVVQDWDRSLQDSQNLCSFFIPSLVDPSVCPPGKHTIHVYSSGGEPCGPHVAQRRAMRALGRLRAASPPPPF